MSDTTQQQASAGFVDGLAERVDDLRADVDDTDSRLGRWVLVLSVVQLIEALAIAVILAVFA